MLYSRKGTEEFLSRTLEDWRWLKRLPKERLLAELRQLKVPPRFKTEPWLHQLVCFYLAMAHPRFLWLLDMGLGKSKIIMDIITQRQRERKLDRALIVVPRIINISSWADDLAKHSNLEPWLIDVENIEEKRHRLLHPRGDVTVIDTLSLQWALCDKVPDKRKKSKKDIRLFPNDDLIERLHLRYNFLDIDEIHKFQSRDNLWFLMMNRVSRGMEYVYGNTGTLFGRNVDTMWTPFYLVDRGETLGETLGAFRSAFFDVKANPWKGEVYTFNKDMEEKLNDVIQHRSIRYEENEVQDLPPLMGGAKKPLMRVVEMSDEQREHYNRALEGLINAGGNLRELDAQYIRMRQIVSGYLAWKDSYGDHVKYFAKNHKLDDLEAFVDEKGDSKIIIVYWYTLTGQMIVNRIKSMGLAVEWLYGGTKDHAALRKRIMDPRGPSVLVMQAEAGGTGLDGLQDVARYMYMYETPESPITRRQTEKRIHRQGQSKRTFIYDSVMRRSIDKGILDNLREGIDTHDTVVNGKRRSRGFFLGDC
jgi:superfamily II DNA or RNA helicase